MTRRKATETLTHRVSNYPDLPPKMPRYCCPVEISYFDFLVFRNMTEI